MMKQVGFIGLGRMGRWMAVHLIKKGFELSVCDIDAQATRFLSNQGAATIRNPAAIGEAVDTVFLCLPNANVVEEVLFAEDGLIQKAKSGLIVVDTGTTAYFQTLDFAQRLRRRGIVFADAPVTGMEARAREGTLTIMFGGDRGIFDLLHPALEAMAKEIVFMGEVGTGQLAKLINNLLFNVNIAALAEILPMAAKFGLEPQKISQVITTGTGRSYAAEFFIPLILENRFDIGYSLKSAYKDMISAAELSAHHNIPMPLVHSATTTYQMALADGHGDENKGAMIKVFERILGVEFRKKGENPS